MILSDSLLNPVAQMLDSSDTSRQAQDLGMNQKTDLSIPPTTHKTLTVKILPCKRKPEASEQGNNSNGKYLFQSLEFCEKHYEQRNM